MWVGTGLGGETVPTSTILYLPKSILEKILSSRNTLFFAMFDYYGFLFQKWRVLFEIILKLLLLRTIVLGDLE